MYDIEERFRDVSRRDDCFNHMLPSDVRELIGEIDRLRHEKDLVFKRMEYTTEEHAKLMVRMADSEKVIEAARSLWDNRLGHGDPTGPWHSPQDFWKDLGQALVEYARD